jgi:hypothetical protein
MFMHRMGSNGTDVKFLPSWVGEDWGFRSSFLKLRNLHLESHLGLSRTGTVAQGNTEILRPLKVGQLASESAK